MKTTKKLMKISHSVGIIIDKKIRDKLNLNYGDLIEADIKKVMIEDIKTISSDPNKEQEII
jgi:hypothetical protein